MSTIVALNGVSYTIPAVGESGWGTQVSAYLVALSSGVLSKAGGTFTLTADADFGSNYGLKSIYYKSRGTTSTTGIVRLANAESVGWRNALNSADYLLKVNSSNVLEFDGNPLLTLALGAADTALVMNAGATAYQFAKIANANVSASAAIAYSKLSLTSSIVNADIGASAAIAYSKLNLATSIVNADVSGSAAIAYSKLNLATSIVNADIGTSAAIAYSKLSLTGSIVNADIGASAAIAHSKIAALTASKALVSDGSGFVSAATTTSTQIGYLSAATGTTGTASTNLVYSSAPTITNATLTTPTVAVVDTALVIQASGAPTSKFNFDASSITAGQTRNIVIPDANLTVVGVATTQTLTGKTLTSPAINTPNLDGGSATSTSRIIVSMNGTSTLSGLPRAKAAIYYDQTLDTIKYDNGSNLIQLQSDVSTTKGDLFVRTSSLVTRLGVGTNNQLLVADSAQTEGIKWASTLSGLTLTSPNLGTSAIMKAAAPLKFNNSADTFFVALQAGTLSASTTWTLPTADGSASQVLKTDGAGALGWATVLTSALNQFNVTIGDSTNTAQVTSTHLLGSTKAITQSSTVTVTIAAPGVVTYTSHGLSTADKVYFTTSGALPTGLTASTTYFVVTIDANTFSLATSEVNAYAGTKITTTGSQSGTHTLFAGGLISQLATSTQRGGVSATTQTFAGRKSAGNSKVLAYLGTNQTISSATASRILFDTEVYDTNAEFDSTSTKGRFTATVAGYYWVYAKVRTSTSVVSPSGSEIEIFKNGTRFTHCNFSGLASTANDEAQSSALIQLDGASDYIEVKVYNGEAGNMTIDSNGADMGSCYVQIVQML